MIESTKLKKMLHILKTNSKDLNIDISIIDYDTMVECDYEVLILYLKETNTQNGAVVYKNFIIRSQLYYNDTEDKYYSALDADIIRKDKALSKINILTTITEATFLTDDINIDIELIDADTQEPLKNQSVYMYISGTTDEAVMSARTDKNGKATFNFYLSEELSTFLDEHLLYFEYKGNERYRKARSQYVTINFSEIKEKNIESSLEACLTPTEDLVAIYNIKLEDTNLIDGLQGYTTLNLNESDVLNGKVIFYINKDNTNKVIGEGTLINAMDRTYSAIKVPFDNRYYNQEIQISAVFEGNNLFLPNTASKIIEFQRQTPTNINLDVEYEEDSFNTRVSFDIISDLPDYICESGLSSLYQIYGEIFLYIENSDGEWGTLNDNYPFYIANNLNMECENNVCHISTDTDFVIIDKTHYGLGENDPIYVKAEYSGNSIINNFDINNKP